MIHAEHITPIPKLNFKIQCLKSSLCYKSDAYIIVKETISVPITATTDTATNNGDKKVIFKKCDPFTDCINKINNT